jgi:uncharacterized membrane protein (DUF485 family)
MSKNTPNHGSTYARVRANPKFQELVRKRSSFATMLSLLVLGSYYALVAVIAISPNTLRTPLIEGGALTIAVPIGAVIIIGSWLLTGWYVSRANGEFDELTQAIVKEASK